MNRRFGFALLSAILSLILLSYNLIFHPPISGARITAMPRTTHRILLVPLDSRPPCRNLVIDAARRTGCEILSPPGEILDYYSAPGDTEAIQKWIMENIADCDAAILSVDQLLHGGLLASREAKKTPKDARRVLAFLRSLHATHPDVPLYAFNILPRILPADSIDGRVEKKQLMEYSRLSDIVDLVTVPEAEDLEKLQRLRTEIPPESLRRYDALFAENAQLNLALIDLAADGTLARLVIGQDDGERYGIPNREKRALERRIQAMKLTDDQVFLTFGADEIALSLLAFIEAKNAGYVPRVALSFNSEKTPWRIMPYMAATMETTALEKIRLAGGDTAPENAADFTLYLSANDRETLASRKTAADEVKSALLSGGHIALVDLSEHFSGDEAMLPFLVKNGTPLHALAAYAGWNTASNAIGTAVAEAVLFETALRRVKNEEELSALAHAHFTSLDRRFLEDYFYLKDIIDGVNLALIRAGYVNTSDLDLEHNARWANDMVQKAMKMRADTLSASRAWRAPVTLTSPCCFASFAAKRLTSDAWHPWPRTFEIRVEAETEVLRMEK